MYARVSQIVAKESRTIVTIETPPPLGKRVRHGYVVRLVDAALRAGATDVRFVGTTFPRPTPAAVDVDLAQEITSLAALPRGFPRFKVEGTWVDDGSAPAPPIADGLSPSAWAKSPPPELPPSLGVSAFHRPGFARDRLRSANPIGAKEDAAVESVLDWLKAHQSPDGVWQAAEFARWCDRAVADTGPDGAGKAENDVAVTGLALLVHLGAGYTNRSEGPRGKVVGDGLRWLKNVQDGDGCFGNKTPPAFLCAHAVATLAMVEAYGMTGSAIYKPPAQRAVDFLVAAGSESGPWKHGKAFGEGAASTIAWVACVLDSVRHVNDVDEKAGKSPSLVIAESAYESSRGWASKAGDSPAALAARILLGEPATSGPLASGIAALVAKPPTWDADPSKVDLLSWLWGSIAAYRSGDEAWTKWKPALSAALLAHQRTEGDRCGLLGSFDAIGPSGAEGGRVMTTALAALCLETPLRLTRPETAPPK